MKNSKLAYYLMALQVIKLNLMAVRVSTGTQKDDLASQADYVSKAYPQARIITDIGSGMNFKRKKFVTTRSL